MTREAGDITLDHGNLRFTYRVAAIGIYRERALLQQIRGTDWWFLPGGHGRIGEIAEDGLRREMREELGEDVRVERLLWVAENFFNLNGRDFHEVSLLFQVTFLEDSRIIGMEEKPGIDGGNVEVLNRWHDIAELETLTLVPSFLKKGLQNLPGKTVYITHRDYDPEV